MTNQVIPAEAVEAAAKAYRREFPYDENEGYIIKIILDAAAPYIRAQAWDGGRDATIRAVMSGEDYPTNPYMLNTEGEK